MAGQPKDEALADELQNLRTNAETLSQSLDALRQRIEQLECPSNGSEVSGAIKGEENSVALRALLLKGFRLNAFCLFILNAVYNNINNND